MLGKFITLCALLASLPCNSMEEKKFPFPELEGDFGIFASSAAASAKKYGEGQTTYRKLTLPYAPLDLSDRGKVDPQKFRDLRNLAFGFVGGQFKTRPDFRINEFFCKSCWDDRIEKMRGLIPQLVKVRDRMATLADIKVVSQWRMKEKFRVNDWFYSDGAVLQANPSKDFGSDLAETGVS